MQPFAHFRCLLATGQLAEGGEYDVDFDHQNNDFGWAHLPKSFMNQNTVFLLLTAMAANFYQYIVSLPLMCLFGVEATDRVKSFLFKKTSTCTVGNALKGQ